MIANKKIKILFAGGGTGGHLYPAISVAQQIKSIEPNAEILFIGTKDKIEAKVVPNYGFQFKPITISGFSRKLNLSNLLFPFKLCLGFLQSLAIYIKFKPDMVVGTGAYVSGPIGFIANRNKLVLLEQNSYPGVTNKLLSKKTKKVYISFEDSRKYFTVQNNIELVGNPIRINLSLLDKSESLKKYNLDLNKKTILVLGGSLGALTINNAIETSLEDFQKNNIQLIWQTGERFYTKYSHHNSNTIKIMPFIEDMNSAFSACDLVVTRAGATTIAELAYLGLAALFIPSKNVAEDHQYKNALSLVKENAAALIKDENLEKELYPYIERIIFNENLLDEYKININKFSNPEAAKLIASDILDIIKGKK